MCERLVQSRYPKAWQPGFEPATYSRKFSITQGHSFFPLYFLTAGRHYLLTYLLTYLSFCCVGGLSPAFYILHSPYTNCVGDELPWLRTCYVRPSHAHEGTKCRCRAQTFFGIFINIHNLRSPSRSVMRRLNAETDEAG